MSPTPASIRRYCPRGLSLLALFAGLLIPAVAVAWGTTIDPVFVFYPEYLCGESEISLELWDRAQERWIPHPDHPRIAGDSCQLEDAGQLFNEIRWRCPDSRISARASLWNLGLRVFRPNITQHCDVTRSSSGFGATEIQIFSPDPNVPIRDPDARVDIAGSVRVGGVAGGEYDVMIAIDTSLPARTARGRYGGAARAAQERLVAQVDAARAFVESMRWRLGPVRVGIVAFPGLDPRKLDSDPAHSVAHAPQAIRTLPLTDDIRAIEAALTALARTPPAGPMSFSDGLALAIDELFRPPGWPGVARPHARRIVMLAADGSGGFPFGPAAQEDREFRERNVERAQAAAERGVALHLFALGGLAERPPAFIEQMLAAESSSFTRVQSQGTDGFFAERVSMPHLDGISIRDVATGRLLGDVSYGTDGRFTASTLLAPGTNQLLVRAQISNGERIERQLVLDFDDRAFQERVLAEEAARIRRARRKHLRLEVED